MGRGLARFKDYPHLQMDFGLTINDLQEGKRPKITQLASEDTEKRSIFERILIAIQNSRL